MRTFIWGQNSLLDVGENEGQTDMSIDVDDFGLHHSPVMQSELICVNRHPSCIFHMCKLLAAHPDPATRSRIMLTRDKVHSASAANTL